MTDREYRSVHDWIKDSRGVAAKCEIDESHTAKKFHWANISRLYKREVNDWIQLCPRCHRIFDERRLSVFQLKKIYRERGKLLEQIESGSVSFSKPLPPPTPEPPAPRPLDFALQFEAERMRQLEENLTVYAQTPRAKRRPAGNHTTRLLMQPVRRAYAESLA